MNSISIYKIENKLFFVPHCTLGKYFSTLIEPITEASFDESDSKIGEIFISTLGYCTNASSRAEMPEGGFKKLLQVTKVRSQINLVKMAQYIAANLDENNFTLKRIGANIRYKGFMVDLGIAPIVLNESANSELIGMSIKELFLIKI